MRKGGPGELKPLKPIVLSAVVLDCENPYAQNLISNVTKAIQQLLGVLMKNDRVT